MFEGLFKQYITPKNVIFIIGIILLAAAAARMPEVALMFFASFVISCSLEPAAAKLTPRFKKSTASLIVLTGAVLVLCAFVIPIAVIGTHEVKIFASSFPAYIDSINELTKNSKFLSMLNLPQLDMTGIISSVSDMAAKILSQTINAGKHIGSAIVYIIVSILIIYYFMTDKEKIRAAVLRLFPKTARKRAGEIFDAISARSGGYITAQLCTMASVGLIVTIGLVLIKSEYALLLGLISAVFDIVPVAGPIAAFIICIIAVSKSGAAAVILTAVIFAAAQLIENNFVRPYVFSRFLNLHPLIIYLFIFASAKYMGAPGLIFAPAIAAAAVVLIEEIYMKNMD